MHVKEEDRPSDETKAGGFIEPARFSKGLYAKIGEEWEADSVWYKVGSKGERLHLTLVKKGRNRYHMVCYAMQDVILTLTYCPQPKDSQHPDRAAALEIYVKTWVTKEPYKEAAVRRELIWRDVPLHIESRTPEVLGSPSKSGKDPLWGSIQGSPMSCRLFCQSLPSSATLHVNPFQQSQSHSSLRRRVASPSSSVSPHLTALSESPTCPGFHSFSKWEKQCREAIVKIHAIMQKQKKAQVKAARAKVQ